MQPSPSSLPSKAAVSGASGAVWVAIALPLLVFLAAFLGGATQRWSEAIVLGSFALLLLARPPRRSLGPALNVTALLFLALAAAAFLPADWFTLPAWRVAMTKDFGVQLPATVSAQPWMTAESFLLLLAGLSWIYYLTTLELHLRDVRLAARVFSGSMIALAALCVYLRFRHSALPFWHNELGFGPFPNRNQTGDLFGISTLLVLGCMQDDFRRGHKRWIVWLLGLGILIAALIFAFSRAGILILVIGVAAWLVRFAFRKWSGAGVAISASVLLLLFAGLLIFGGKTIERFDLRLGSEGAVTAGYRLLIFRDAWAMIKSSPWVGLGLGNFESVFALFRDASSGVTRSLHPESDWFWVGAEMGPVSLLLILVGGGLLVRRSFPLKEGTNQRLRYTALVGALLFALHGFVDVSGHRVGSFLAGTFLLGLAQFRPLPLKPSRVAPILFRVVGLLLVVVSVAWFFSWRRALPLPGRIGLENARHGAVVSNRGHRFKEAIALTDQALTWAPLDWQLYFLRASARIGLHEPVPDVLADFRRARFLEPSAYQLPFEEGKAWLGWQPTLAITAWRNALQRRGADEAGIYTLMLAEAASRDAKVHDALRDFALNRPDLMIKYLEVATASQFETVLRDLRARDPALAEFTSAQRMRLFALWSRREPLDELVQAVEAHPEWREFAWPGLARYHAGRGEFAAAWEIVRQNAPAPLLPQAAPAEPIPQLEHNLYSSPGDFAVGYALYQAQMAAGQADDALATARHFTAQPEAPAYFQYLQAQAWAAKGDLERAWRSWQEYDSRRTNR
ncbi:MAG: O-antigen ligase family protein [Chthoniobacterales bacterium]|nr:O-antigen ligase family protein [Chthoniobacterales bacterium]